MSEDKPEFMLRPNKDETQVQKTFILRSAIALYSLMAAFSFAWAFVREDLDLFHHPDPAFEFPWHAGLWGGLAAGIAFGYLVALLSTIVADRAGWARKLLFEMKSILGGLSWKDALFLAMLSALCEEIFFRGVLQSHLGLFWSSIIFGLAHIPRNRTFILWTLEATLLGFCLGLLFMASGNLIAPIAAHFTINFKNLMFLNKFET